MSDQNSVVWYITISHLNKYLFIDIMKALGAAAALLLVIQLLPIGQSATTLSTIIMAGLVFWGVALVIKLFTAFNGHSIRFTLNEEGVTAMADEGKLGLSYVARQVSSMKWDPMHAGSMRAENIQPEKTQLSWSNVTGVNVDEENRVISLRKGTLGSMRLYCSEDNFDAVLGKVYDKCRMVQAA